MDMQECDIMFCCKYCHTGKYQRERRNYQVFKRIYLIWESLITVRLEKITELKLMTPVVCILYKENHLAYACFDSFDSGFSGMSSFINQG